MSTSKGFDKYRYYETSVQDPGEHISIFDHMYRDLNREEKNQREAVTLREDFCGTFLISCEWVKSRPFRKGLGLDLDSEPTDYGYQHGYKKLTASQKRRLKIINQDVCISTPKHKVDIICACNFSFNIFKSREKMKTYLKAALASLNPQGLHVLELAGGPGFVRTGREQKTYRVKGLGRYLYYWDQKSFDPITHNGVFAIHFRDQKGKLHKDCFIYDWRVWTIPELKEMMLEVGFKDAAVFWEATDARGQGIGEYVRMENGDNDYSWIAFVVGRK